MIVTFTERILAPVGPIVGTAIATFGAFVAADSSDVERFVGGGIIVTAGVLLVRWALKTSERVESTYVQALASANSRAERCEKECGDLRRMYDQERTLRIQLEQQGMSNRRTDPRDIPIDEDRGG